MPCIYIELKIGPLMLQSADTLTHPHLQLTTSLQSKSVQAVWGLPKLYLN